MIVHKVPAKHTTVDVETGSHSYKIEEKIYLEVNREEAYLIANLLGQVMPAHATCNMYDAIFKSGLFSHYLMKPVNRLPFVIDTMGSQPHPKVDTEGFCKKLALLGFDPTKIDINLAKYYKAP